MPQTLNRPNRPNRYPGTCIRCRGHVDAGQGLLARTDTGAWAVDHDGPCPEKPTTIAQPEPVAKADTDGIYRTPDGSIYKVQEARQGSGRLYAKRLVVTECTDTFCGHPTIADEDGRHRHGHFVYAPGIVHTLLASQRMSEHDARAFGRLYGVCVRCGADLTDEDSIARGMGRICAGYFA